jgi:hypothetical protein
MSNRGFDYFENSRRATLAQQAYCAANPGGWAGYSDSLWGITASDDTGRTYSARGAPPPQGDDGTLVPTASISSLPFAPDEVLPTIWNMWNNYRGQLWTPYGFRDAFNLTYNWWGPDVIGIDQGPIIIMIENYRTGSVWSRFMQNADIQRGLTRIGFQTVSDVHESPSYPVSFTLDQNYPNPFNAATVISYSLPAGTGSGASMHVSLRIYDVLGREVALLVNDVQPAGDYRVEWDASRNSSGVYACRISAGTFSSVRHMLLIK